jgi:hypothetical protein
MQWVSESNKGNTMVRARRQVVALCACIHRLGTVRWRTVAFRSILRRISNDSLHLILGASPRRTFVDESRNRALRIQIRIPSSSRPPFAPHFRESLRY